MNSSPGVLSRPVTVGFVVWPQRGHIYPTLYLAKRLRERGADILYFGGESARALVEEQGFAFAAVIPEAGSAEIPQELRIGVQRAFLERVLSRLERILRERRITHLFVDPLFHLASIPALSAGIHVRHFWVMNPPHRRGRQRPFGLSFAVHNSTLARLAPQLLWIPEWFRSNTWLARVYPRRAASDRLTREAAVKHRLGIVLTSYGYQFELPTVIFGPQSLAHSHEPGCEYLGLGVEESRSEPAAELSRGRKLVYCSLGSNFALYRNAAGIVREVIRVAAAMPEIDFIIQAPKDSLSDVAMNPNVTVVERAPTLQILARASAAITHGGYGGVKECIFYRVPSLVIPFLFDQPANAVLFADRGLGLALSPRSATAGRIRAALQRLLSEETFRRALADLRARAVAEDRYDAFCGELLATETLTS
jgi:UDP:flavonoid glycosyltransferase YjiC (YdhE family)